MYHYVANDECSHYTHRTEEVCECLGHSGFLEHSSADIFTSNAAASLNGISDGRSKQRDV